MISLIEYPQDILGYRIVEKNIGVGGFAAVHLASCDRGQVALKVPNIIDTKATMDSSVLNDFENEAKIWKTLSDKNIKGIVKLHACGSTPYPWMALEYMDSGTLADVMSKLSMDESIKIATDLLDTLFFAHHSGVIHRDIKPTNILVNSKGEFKLTDWGLGKVLLSASISTIGFKGTLAYSAPEQYNTKKFGMPDWRTDIFQMGAVIYHMITGKPPVPNDLTEAMFLVINGDIDPPIMVNPKVPQDISDVIMKALEVRKQNRWMDATSFRMALLGMEDSAGTGLAPIGDGKASTSPSRSMYISECPECGNSISDENKKLICKDCSSIFCNTCQEWNETLDEYRGKIIPSRKPLCKGCNNKYYDQMKTRIDSDILKKQQAPAPAEEEDPWHELITLDNAVEKQKMWASYMKIPVEWTNPVGIKFVLIPAGEFMMGADSRNNSRPVHRIRIEYPFYAGVNPVLQGEWEKVMGGENPSKFQSRKKSGLFKQVNQTLPDHPVESVSWHDAKGFLKSLNDAENTNKYRLPTEAEWEYLCRAGSTSSYFFGERQSQLGAYAWFKNNSEGRTHPVGKLTPNEWELHDTLGNVWEWCEDWFDENFYGVSPRSYPRGPASGTLKAARGGCWNYDGDLCTSSTRGFVDPEKRYNYLGFRVVKSIY